MFPGVSRICWKACSILNLGISTFSIAVFPLCTKFVVSHKRRQLEQMLIPTFLALFNCTISCSSGSYVFPYTLTYLIFPKVPKSASTTLFFFVHFRQIVLKWSTESISRHQRWSGRKHATTKRSHRFVGSDRGLVRFDNATTITIRGSSSLFPPSSIVNNVQVKRIVDK